MNDLEQIIIAIRQDAQSYGRRLQHIYLNADGSILAVWNAGCRYFTSLDHARQFYGLNQEPEYMI